MSRRVLALLTVLLLAAGLAPVAEAAPDRSGSYIVVLHRSVADPEAVAREHAREHGAQVGHVYRYALKGYSASLPESRVAAIRADSRVAAVNADAPVTALGHGANAPTGVSRTFATTNSAVGIDGHDDKRVDVDIAIIDTGIDIDHPDLNVVGGKNCQKGTTYDDGNGHGTHVAGSAAGLDNGNGVVGMAPGARLWAVRVLDNSGSGSWSSVICGVDWVTGQATTSNKIEVANMSLGGSGSDPDNSTTNCSTGNGLHDAICKSVAAGTTYAVAAGNSSADSKDHVPAAFDEVITVSALADFDGAPGGLGSPTCRTDVDDTFASFSNYGADVDLIAPGVCIRSAWKGGGYNTISGTSMASPHVAGAAALLKATTPSATPAEVQTTLQGAGNLNWSNGDDRDSIKEVLVDVSSSTIFAPAQLSTGSTTSPNSAPVASDDSAATSVDTSVVIAVLANDSDADGDALTVTDLTAPANGGVALNADGTVTYTPNAGFVGSDSFTYTAFDGSATSNVATVTVNVTDPAASPALSVTVAKDGVTTKQGPWYRANVKVSVTDGTNVVEGASVTLEIKSEACPGVTSHGSATGTTGTDGSVTFSFKSRTQGTYCGLASATMSGYTSGSGSSSFAL